MARGKARQEADVEAGTGLSAVIETGSKVDTEAAVSAAIQADEAADEALDEPPVTGTFTEDEEEDEGKRERVPGGKYWANGGMGQVQLISFPIDPVVVWAVDAYTAKRIQRERAQRERGVPADQLGPSFAQASYQERIARMIAECVGILIAEDVDKKPEDRLFDWDSALTLPLGLVVHEMASKRWSLFRETYKEQVKKRLRLRFPNLTEGEIDGLAGLI